MSKLPMNDLVVLLPGITGSELRKYGKVVWGFNALTAIKGLLSKGNSLVDALQFEPGNHDNLDPSQAIEATRLLPDLHLIPGLWKIDGYGAIARYIKNTFEVVDGENFLQFPYDWRQDNRLSASTLDKLLKEKLRAWRKKSGNGEAKIIYIAHSMGGLVSLYQIEVLGGWREAAALITFGTPFEGSLNALTSLVNGVEKFGSKHAAINELIRTFPSIYQLLPTFKCISVNDTDMRNLADAGLSLPFDDALFQNAVRFHAEIGAAIRTNMKDQLYQDAHYDVLPIVGVAQKTKASAKYANGKIAPSHLFDGAEYGGDGTVPRFSAFPSFPEFEPRALYLSDNHGSMQNVESALEHVSGLLSEDYFSLGPKRATARISVELDDFFWKDEPVTILATPKRAVSDLSATLINSQTGERVAAGEFVQDDTKNWRLLLENIPSATYKVVVSGPGLDSSESSFAVSDTTLDEVI